MMAKQYPLSLPITPDYSRLAFLEGMGNREGLAALGNTKNWTNNILALVGPKGSGKTHLGHIWTAEHDAIVLDLDAEFTPSSDWNGKYLWVDEAARADEFTLFTLINLAIVGNIKGLLLTDREPPSSWPMQIPDLHSRLRNVAIARLQEQDDDVLRAVIDKMFKDRGLKVKDNLIKYLLLNTERSVDALRALIVDLDTEAAAQKAEVTRSFAAQFLKTYRR